MNDKRIFEIFCKYVKRFSCDEANTSQDDVHAALLFLAEKANTSIKKCPGLWCRSAKLNGSAP